MMNSELAEQRVMLADTLSRLFRDSASTQTTVSEGWNAALWQQLDDMGLLQLLVPEAAGGIGGNWEDAQVVAQAVGAHAIGLPVCEAMLAMSIAAQVGLVLHAGTTGLAPTAVGSLERNGSQGLRFTGTLHSVPWGRHLAQLVTVAEHNGRTHLILLPRSAASALRESRNPAGEPRDKLYFDATPVEATPCDAALPRRLAYHCALMRVGQIAGALDTVLARSIQYARERVQFGKPIGNFQAVQQQLAVFGSEVAAVGCAARAAFRSAALGEATFEIAAAKLRANLAIDAGTAIAHQVHGAIGFTHEYDLRHFTQRLWSWRSEFGNDRLWSETLGRAVIARGVDAFWSDLTQRGDVHAPAAVVGEASPP
jgi:acyl-CoA dehydrogenase